MVDDLKGSRGCRRLRRRKTQRLSEVWTADLSLCMSGKKSLWPAIYFKTAPRLSQKFGRKVSPTRYPSKNCRSVKWDAASDLNISVNRQLSHCNDNMKHTRRRLSNLNYTIKRKWGKKWVEPQPQRQQQPQRDGEEDWVLISQEGGQDKFI